MEDSTEPERNTAQQPRTYLNILLLIVHYLEIVDFCSFKALDSRHCTRGFPRRLYIVYCIKLLLYKTAC